MIYTIVLNSESRRFTNIDDPDGIDRACAQSPNIVWVDVSDPTSQDFIDLAREFGFHPLSIEDCRNKHERPKLEEYSGYYFIVLYEATLVDGNRLDLRELNIFLGRNYIVTVHSQPIEALQTAERLWREWTDLAERGTGLLAYLLIDAIVDGYLPVLDAFSEDMDRIEAKIFNDFEPHASEDIFHAKKQLLFFRRTVTPLRDAFNVLLRREQPIFSRETYIYFQDVFDHLVRVGDMIDTLREMLGSTMDAYLSVSSNRMNMVMKRLTSVATILMSVTLIAGIYGMNFQHMPELAWRFGYIAALALMSMVGVSLYAYLRKIEWL